MLFFLLLPRFVSSSTCLIGCRNVSSSVPTSSGTIQTLLSASIGAFSVDFNETCALTSPLKWLSTDPSTSEYYEYTVLRTSNASDPRLVHGNCSDTNLTTSFSYLNSPQSGAVSSGSYSYSCSTTDFYPDDSYAVQPDSRNQTCMYGLMLVPAVSDAFGAAFWTKKQQVAYGFNTTFTFRVLRQSSQCDLLESPNAASWCYTRGSRGFAFVVQNVGSPGANGSGDTISNLIGTLGSVNLGYTFPRNLAVEFDYFFDPDSNDPSWNHIAVMVPVVKQPSERSNSNSANHQTNLLAITDGVSLPPLNVGTHTVEIAYNVTDTDSWQHLAAQWYSRPLTADQQAMFTYWSYNRPGLLTIVLDGSVVLRTLVDIAQVAQVDSVSSYANPAPSTVNTAYPGSAWVGFVSATSAGSYASPLITQWNFTASDNCPGTDVNGTGAIVCSQGSLVEDSLPVATRFSLRNIGRTDVRLAVRTADATASSVCTNTDLRWNQIHPYFLGCQKQVQVGPNVTALVITDVLNVRSVQVTDPALIDRDYVSAIFLRRQIPDYCVIEDQLDQYRFSLGYCDCSFCARVFDNQQLYAVFYSQLCSKRYTYTCNCFEVSQMNETTFYTDYLTAANPWKVIGQPGYAFTTKTMQFQSHSVCVGCKYDSQCSWLNPFGSCNVPDTPYRVGNPLTPTIGGSFQNWTRGTDDPDGSILGDACDCGDRQSPPSYVNMQSSPFLLPVFLTSYLQGSSSACISCLRVPDSSCVAYCGSPAGVNYLHYPSGQSCSTCIFASSSLFNLSPGRALALRTCVYASIETGGDPFTACVSTVQGWYTGVNAISESEAAALSQTYLNGVATHFLAECPSRDMDLRGGAVCVPNLRANPVIPMQVISRGSAEASVDGVWFPVWWDGVGCLNAACELQARSDCYVRLHKFVFTSSPDNTEAACKDILNGAVGCYLVNSAGFNATNNTAVFKKSEMQYGYTDPLDRTGWITEYGGMVDKTLEVWASVAPEDAISDLALSSTVTVASSWGESYLPSLAVDGDIATFWQSGTSQVAAFAATWEIDFGASNVKNAQGYIIYWKYFAANFTVSVAEGSGTWAIVDDYSDNAENLTVSSSFFVFTKLRVEMTVANQTRPTGQDAGYYAYGISEIRVLTDTIVSRLKPIATVQNRNFPASHVVDNDWTTWWSTPPGVDQATLVITPLPTISDSSAVLSLIQIVARKGFVPTTASVYLVPASGTPATIPITCNSIGCTSTSSNYLNSLSVLSWNIQYSTLTEVGVDVVAGSAYYDSSIVQISEVELYTLSASANVYTSSVCMVASSSPPTACTSSTSVAAGKTKSFSVWTTTALSSSSDILGVLTLNFATSALPTSVSISRPSLVGSDVFGPYTSVVAQSNTFAVRVLDKSGLVVNITAGSAAVTIATMHFQAIERIDLTTATAAASSTWSATSVDVANQGAVANLVDGDYTTEFRTALGAPAIVSTFSIDLNYVINVVFPTHLSADVIFIDFSYQSQWFRIDAVPAVTGADSSACEWTPSQNLLSSASTVDCLSTAIGITSTGDYYHFAMAPIASVGFGQQSWSGLKFTIMQSSAFDTIQGLPVIGVRELQAFSAYPPRTPVAVLVNTLASSGTSAMFDSNFTTSWSSNVTSAGTTLLIDFPQQKRVKDIQVWWAANVSSAQVTVGVAVSPSACAATASQTFTDSTLSYSVASISPLVPVTYSPGPGGYVVGPVQCVRIILASSSPVTLKIGEISVRSAEPSYFATVVDSSLENPELAVDGDSLTSATASATVGGNAVTSHYIMLDLNNVGLSLWGVSVIVQSPSTGLDGVAGSVVLYACGSTDSIDTCVAAGNAVSIATSSSSARYIFGPKLLGTATRVALVVNAASFLLADLAVFASANEAITSAVTFNDDRVWDYSKSSAVDGDIATAFYSEVDVTSGSLDICLMADCSISASPPQLASIDVFFALPTVADFTVSYSVDGSSWTLLGAAFTNFNGLNVTFQNAFVLSNFLRIDITKINVDTALTDTVWASPMFAVKEVVATIVTSLEQGKTAVATTQAVSANYGPLGAWFALPPIATATYTLPSTVDVSGVVFVWSFPPATYSIACIAADGSTIQSNAGSTTGMVTLSTPTSALPTTTSTLTGAQNVRSLSVTLTSFNTRNNVEFALLKSITVYTPSVTQSAIVTVIAPADDDSPDNLHDGDTASFYTSPSDPTTTPVVVNVTLASSSMKGKLVVLWRTVCADFDLTGVLASSGRVVNITTVRGNTQATTTVLFSLAVTSLALTLRRNVDNSVVSFSIFEISVFDADIVAISSAVQAAGTPAAFEPVAAIDGVDASMWMAAPSAAISELSPVTFTVDLGGAYPVSSISILWGFTPFLLTNSDDVIHNKRDVLISTDGNAFTSIGSEFTFNSTNSVESFTGSSSDLVVRSLRVVIKAYYLDTELDPLVTLIGPSLRNIGIELDKNVFRGAESDVVENTNWWDFPPALMIDARTSTQWISKRGTTTAVINVDLGASYLVAGIELDFTYPAGSVSFASSSDCAAYSALGTAVTGNTASSVVLSGQLVQFQARCVRITLSSPVMLIANPDNPSGPTQSVLGISRLSVFHDVGGGGVFGIEAEIGGQWGTVFDTIAYAPFQPKQWNMLSNQQARSENVNGPTSFDDISSLVQIVATFGPSTVTLYRNGVRFGSSYTASPIAWDTVDNVRLVFGVRSTAFVGADDAEVSALMGDTLPGNQDSLLNPFFSGQIQSVSLYSQSLLAEEVFGLYEAVTRGTRERGCLCYDDCPYGQNRLYPNVDVPCSGQGVCQRRYNPITHAPIAGVCVCTPGFSGANCANHCSEYGGCCSVNDDCSLTQKCDVATSTCITAR